MTDRIEQIKARLAEATRGPWRWDEYPVPTLYGVGGTDDYSYEDEVIEASHSGECGCRSACELEVDVAPANRRLIANAPEDIAWLLGEVERLTEANDRLAKIAASVAPTLEQGKRDLMAHGWEQGAEKGHRLYAESIHYIQTLNPYRGEAP
jgi:hypothetical protein